MSSDFIDKLKVEFQKLNFDFKDRIKFSSNDGITKIKLPTCTIKIYRSNYGYKIECDICFKGFDTEMSIMNIDFFKDQSVKANYIYSVEDIFNILKKHNNDILNSKTIPDWYLNYVGWKKFSSEVLNVLYGLSPKDIIRIKWLNKDSSWKIDFKEKYPGINKLGNDFYWSTF